MYVGVGAMKDEKLKLMDLRVSNTLVKDRDEFNRREF